MEGNKGPHQTEPGHHHLNDPHSDPVPGKGHQHKGQDYDPDQDSRLTPNGLEGKEGSSGGGGGSIMDSGIAGDDVSAKLEDWAGGASDDMGSSCEGLPAVNGDIFSPDSADMVTVICAASSSTSTITTRDRTLSQEAEEDQRGRSGSGGGGGSDTHSDSIETLEEDEEDREGVGGVGGRGCQDNEDDDLNDRLLQQMVLTSKCSRQREGGHEEEDGAMKLAVDSSLESSVAEEYDSVSTDSHEILLDSSSVFSGSIASRPESLYLPRSLQQQLERHRSSSEPQGRVQAVRAEALGHQRTRSEALDMEGIRLGVAAQGEDVMSRSLPHGTFTRKGGGLVEFVADDLTEKIKRSSPMSTAESSSQGSRRSSQRSLASTSSVTSSGLSRSPSSLLTQSPDTAPPIDPAAIMELEMAARRVADNVDHMMGNLRNNLHKMSAITVGCSEAYKTSVDITCESVDSSIKSMYALMAKCEELSKTMTPIYQIGTQIKEIKRLLDRFEAQLSEKP